MPDPLVSVIIPNYNYGRFIAQSIESVLAQTFTDFEIIVIDGNSTDDSVAIVRSLQARNPGRIHLVQKEHEGVSSSRNAGLLAAKGQLISFLDSDDYWDKEFLATMTAQFEDPSCRVAYCSVDLFHSDTGKSLGSWFDPRWRRKPHQGSCLEALFIEGNFIPILGAMLRRSVIDQAGLFDTQLRVGEDWEFWMRVASRHDIRYVDRVLGHVRRHPANQSFLPRNKFNRIHIYRNVLHWDDDLAESLGLETLDRCYYHTYYEVGRALVLSGKPRFARLVFLKALGFRKDYFSERIWLYYPLTYVLTGKGGGLRLFRTVRRIFRKQAV